MHSGVQKYPVVLQFNEPGAGADVGIRIQVRNTHDEQEANTAGNRLKTPFSPPQRPSFAKSVLYNTF
jgi:FKBP-type peptidyl-prolyl cis-trans isomerase 2